MIATKHFKFFAQLMLAFMVVLASACKQKDTAVGTELSNLTVIDMPRYKDHYMEPIAYETYAYDSTGC